MHFAIWSGRSTGISMPKWAGTARHLIDVYAKGWRAALAAMPKPTGAGWEEPITQLEINCHGGPGKLFLPTETGPGLVDYKSVDEFAAMIRPSLSKGALIELLACQVARCVTRFKTEELPDYRYRAIAPSGSAVPFTYSDSVLNEYWGAFDRDPLKGGGGRIWIAEGIDRELALGRNAIAKQYDWGPEDNGLYFCQRLAERSGGIVRAGDLKQDENTDPASMAVDVAGNWEGHVWDFFPDGRVKYLGLNLSRTQSPITWSPTDVHLRPTSATASSTPLRQKRLNRTPLPA